MWVSMAHLKTCNRLYGIYISLADPYGSSEAPIVWCRISCLRIQVGVGECKDWKYTFAQFYSHTSSCFWTRSTYFKDWCKTTSMPLPSWCQLPSKAKDERKQSVINSLIINNEILWSVSVEVGEGLEDERIVEMLSRVQGHWFIALLLLEVFLVSHLPTACL
jgi:hypothetical protein